MRFANSIVGIRVARSMINPPIVGVPCFFLCDWGPSDLISSPIWYFFKSLMIQGPTKKQIIKAVIDAEADRNVIYSKI